MLGNQDKVIDGYTYRVYQLGATPALQVLLELGRMVGPSLGLVMDGAKGGKGASLLEAELSGDTLGRALEGLAARMDTPKVQSIIDRLKEKTQFSSDGASFQNLGPAYEAHFAGRMGALFGWLRFALEVQYGDFFALLANAAPKGSAAVANNPAPSVSPPG